MSSLHAHTNVWETCLQVLERRGYSLHVEIGVDDDDPYLYRAERDAFTVTAWNPIELLGLTAIYEDVNAKDSRPYRWCANTQPRARRGGGLDIQLKAVAHENQQAREAELAALCVERPEEFRAEVQEWWAKYGGVADMAARLGVRASVLVPWLEWSRSSSASSGSRFVCSAPRAAMRRSASISRQAPWRAVKSASSLPRSWKGGLAGKRVGAGELAERARRVRWITLPCSGRAGSTAPAAEPRCRGGQGEGAPEDPLRELTPRV